MHNYLRSIRGDRDSCMNYSLAGTLARLILGAHSSGIIKVN